MQNLLMATDLSARSERALARAIGIARDHGATLTVVHVVDEDLPDSVRAALESGARQIVGDQIANLAPAGTGPKVSLEVVTGRPHREILALAEKTASSVIVLGVHREDAFADIFRSTTAERILRASAVPTLLVKDPADAPYRKAMVGVDFSVYSRRAIEFAAGFAPGAAFHLVHAYDIPFKGFVGEDEDRGRIGKEHHDTLQRLIDEEMKTLLSTLPSGAPTLTPVMAEGSVRQVLRQQAERLKPDLLVLGTHGRTGAGRAILGSVAEDFLGNPPCDLLAVKAW
ncbi:MAG: universal stress protein [Nisaea sp.]|uniref:universal stress protein n=1 Tax=Nisaea sp. TaxID=2024842 RepID=UPI001B03583E|nr:universal stress protein [Nisaea sp.]MBO6562428.1 universal stress protein [Nisaea sp.]